MAIDFPNSPTVGQIFTSGDKSWIWDGTVWKAYGASLSPTVLKVDSTNSRVGINNQSPATALDIVGTTTVRAASTQDGVALAGRAGGTSTYEVTLTPTTLTADRTLTLPDATGTVALTSDPGLVLIKTQTIGTAVASVQVTNAFSSTYDNYLVNIDDVDSSNNTNLYLEVGSATTNYKWSLQYNNYVTTYSALVGNTTAQFQYVGALMTDKTCISIPILGPFLTMPTRVGPVLYTDIGATGTMTGININVASYTSFTIKPAVGTLTGGTIRVYGYRNS